MFRWRRASWQARLVVVWQEHLIAGVMRNVVESFSSRAIGSGRDRQMPTKSALGPSSNAESSPPTVLAKASFPRVLARSAPRTETGSDSLAESWRPMFYSAVPMAEFVDAWPSPVPVHLYGMNADLKFVPERETDF